FSASGAGALRGFAHWLTRQNEAKGKRLLCVALIRARDRLSVRRCSEAEGSLLSELRPSIPAPSPDAAERLVDGCYLLDRERLSALPDEEPALCAEANPAAVEEVLAGRASWAAARDEVIRAAREELAVHPPVPAFLLGADDAPLAAGAGPPAAKGEAMHSVLELVDLHAPDNLEQVAESVCRI